MYKDIVTLKTSFKKLDNISLYEIVTIACVVGIFVNILFSIEIIQSKNTAQYFFYTFILGFLVSFLFVLILFFSMKIFGMTSKNEINISSAKEERYFYYLLLCILVLLYLITVSLISSDYFSFDISGISFVNGVESIVVFYISFLLLLYVLQYLYMNMNLIKKSKIMIIMIYQIWNNKEKGIF